MDDERDPDREPHPIVGTWVGLVGLALIAIAADAVSVPDGAINVPRWVLGLIGVGCLLGAVAAFLPPERRNLPGIGVLAVLALVFNWIAFGLGQRSCTRSFSLPFWPFTSSPGDLECRIAFGFFALLLDLLLLYALVKSLPGARRSSPPRGGGLDERR